MLGGKGKCKSSHIAVSASGCELLMLKLPWKGHGGLYASTSARSSRLLLQLSQLGYRPPCPLWQPRVRDKGHFALLPSKGATPCSTLPYLAPHSLLSSHKGKKNTSKTFKLLPSSLNSPKPPCNILVGRLI